MGGYTGEWVEEWHEDYQPNPYPQVGDIYSGLRASSGGGPKDVTSPCQYWVKGLPGVCGKFVDGGCSAGIGGNNKPPTGYNGGKCDYLGRRSWCDQYNGSGGNLEEYVCIAPDIFRSGLGKRDTSVTTHLVLLPYDKSEILGYNEGKCDGLGMGRGSEGDGITDPEEMYKKPVVCRHYKPWIMGFGSIEPRPMGDKVLTGDNVYDGSPSDPLSTLTRRMPFVFRMYNIRARCQTCAYWAQDFGADFDIDYSGGYASISLSEDPLTECTCTDSASTPYKTVIDEWLPNTSDTLMDVLTKENGIVCNGAKPECPCYTGKWTFCVDDNMCDGMRITAEQIMELRFYMTAWQTKEIYDSVFAEKSGPSGTTTSDLFTFDKWKKLGAKVEDSVMKGKRIYQCFPIPLNKIEFDPDIYLTKESITYPKVKGFTGTSSSTSSNFPTLVRPIDYFYMPVLCVVYPYSNNTPWSVVPCSKSVDSDNMEIASCKLKEPGTAVFGHTARNKTIYALNATKSQALHFMRFKNTKISMLSRKERKAANKLIRNSIDEISKNVEFVDYIAKSVSNEYGYFSLGPIKLEYNITNTLVIICMYSFDEYEVVVRDVSTKFYGAGIIQDDFKFKYGSTDENSGQITSLPTLFAPAAELHGHVHSFGGEVSSVFPVYNKYKYGIMADEVHYSYCINEYEVKEIVNQWVRIGPTGYILAEIDNIKLSYLFDFEVISASIVSSGGDDEIVCGEGGSNVELEVIFPKEGDSDPIKREHMLPNCVVLKAPEFRGFFNDDWTLTVEYKYRMLELHKANASSTERVVWPHNLDNKGSMNKFVEAPFSLTSGEGLSFTVNNIRFGTVAVMAYIVDSKGRLQAAVATKMLYDVVTTRCRPVEISYAYKAGAVGYDLIPNSGFFTWVGGDKALDGGFWHHNRPKCGDHDCDKNNCIGPMWYPFNDCTTLDFYSWYTGAATCTMPIEGQPRSDWRYCMADEYKAWVRAGGNWAASCGNGWYYSYSRAGGANVFTGFAKIRSAVNLIEYSMNGWTPPPFGNDGREITERWLSQEHYGFWDLSGVDPIPRSEYMPLVFDDEMLFASFNAFSEEGRIGPVADCLHTTCMLNYMLSDIISEEVMKTRYRFKELFRVINHARCMYPPPVYEGPGGNTTTARRYSFKIDDVAWAWREYWKEIERGIDGEGILDFVRFGRPDYYFDFDKIEHRLITEEGTPTISFVAPQEGDDGGYTYPEIFIIGGVPRKFEIIYDDYNGEQVDWVEEVVPLGSSFEGGGGGEFGGGGATGGWDLEVDGDTGEGEFDTGVYEKAMGDDWFHDVNTIFDVNASAAKSEDRKIVLSRDSFLGDTFAWYNRGLIANIPKNRLIYLPYEETCTGGMVRETVSDSGTTWTNDALFSKDIIFSHTGGCVTRILIEGSMGTVGRGTGTEVYCLPEITVAECGVDDDVEGCPGESGVPPSIMYTSAGESGSGYSGLEHYSIEVKLVRSPKRMLYDCPLLHLKCTLRPDQSLNLSGNPTVYTSKYIDAVEKIKVWEQRYVTSKGTFGDSNPDGVESYNIRSFDRNLKNAGQYFPTGAGSPKQTSTNMCDKMTIISAGKQYDEDIPLDVSIGNLKSIEKEEQRKLYEDAYNRDDYDSMNYSVIMPISVQQFIDEHNIAGVAPLSGKCVFESSKLHFDDHVSTTSFDQSADFWQPGGHYFRWGDSYITTSCYILGPLETVYFPEVVHYKHGGDSIVYTPYEAYVGWAKYDYYSDKLTQAEVLEKPLEQGYDSAGLIVMETFT